MVRADFKAQANKGIAKLNFIKIKNICYFKRYHEENKMLANRMRELLQIIYLIQPRSIIYKELELLLLLNNKITTNGLHRVPYRKQNNKYMKLLKDV